VSHATGQARDWPIVRGDIPGVRRTEGTIVSYAIQRLVGPQEKSIDTPSLIGKNLFASPSLRGPV
jgi:hypothetical protein